MQVESKNKSKEYEKEYNRSRLIHLGGLIRWHIVYQPMGFFTPVTSHLFMVVWAQLFDQLNVLNVT